MPYELAIAIQIGLPIFIGHLLLLDFLQWRSGRDRFLFAAAAALLGTLGLQFLVPAWKSAFATQYVAYVLIASIFIAPAVSIWEAGVLRLCGWKSYSEAFDVTVRINRLIPVALWAVLFSHNALNRDPGLAILLAVLLGLLIQWLGLVAHSKKGIGGASLQAIASKIATFAVWGILIEPLFGGHSPVIQPLIFAPKFLTAFLLMSVTLFLTGWSTRANSTRKALEICTVSYSIFIGLSIPPSLNVYREEAVASTPLIYGDSPNFYLATLVAAVFAYAFISFSLEKRIVQRARLVPSIVCAAAFGLSIQYFIINRLNEVGSVLVLAILLPSVVALILRSRILSGEKLLQSSNYSGAQVKLESALNMLERISGYKSELTLRCYVGLAEATARQNLFLQASGFVDKALDTIEVGIPPTDEQAIVLLKLAEELYRKNGLAKTNALKERLEKLVPEIPSPTDEANTASGTANGTASNAVTTFNTSSSGIFGSTPWGNTASDAESGVKSPRDRWHGSTSGAIFGGFFARRMAARSSDSSIVSGSVFNGDPREAPPDKSLQAVPPRIANLVAVAPTWDKHVKARTATPAPPAELPGFATASSSGFATGSCLVVENKKDHTAAQSPPQTDPSTESWMRPAPEPNEVSLPTTAPWMKVSPAEQALIDASKDKSKSVSFSLSENGSESVAASDSCSPIGASKAFFTLPSFHKKRDRFDDSGTVFFSWKVWAIKILILVCCPLLLAVSTGLNFLASQNKDLAEACMSSALTIKQVVLGARSPETGHAHQALGVYYSEHGKDELAYLHLKSALSISDENNPLPSEEEDETRPWLAEEITETNELRKKVATLAEGFGDYDAAALMWQDIEAALQVGLLDALKVQAGDSIGSGSSSIKFVESCPNDMFRAGIQAARVRGIQQERDEARKLYAAAFQKRFSIQDNFYVPSKYSIDWRRKIDSPEFYLDAARAAMNYSLIHDAMGSKDKSFIARRYAHLFATRYLQECILEGIKKSKEMTTASCGTAHDTKVAFTVYADGQVANLRILSVSGPSCCDHTCLAALQTAFASTTEGRSGLPIPVELVAPVDLEFGFRNGPTHFSYDNHFGYHGKTDGFSAYIP